MNQRYGTVYSLIVLMCH